MAKYYIKKKEQAKARAEPDNAISADTEVIDSLPARFKDVPPPNRYDDEVREEICKLVLEAGFTIKAAAEKYGIARNTCSAIVREHLAEYDMIENVRLGRKFHKLADRVLNELQERDLSCASPSQLGVLAGIAVDKKTQLMGKTGDLSGGISLKIAWADGSGAVELTAGPANSTGPGSLGPAPSPVFRVRAGRGQDDPGADSNHDMGGNHGPGEVIDVEAEPIPDSTASPPPDTTDNEDDLW